MGALDCVDDANRAMHVKNEDGQKLPPAPTARQMPLHRARQLQDKIRDDPKPFRIRPGEVGSGGFATRAKARLAGRSEFRALAAPLLEMRTALLGQTRRCDRLLRRAAAVNPVRRQPTTAPGAGPPSALAYYAVTDSYLCGD
jgi:transposase